MLAAIIGLAIALILDIFPGDPPNRFHPVVAMGNYIRWFTRKWNQGSSAHRFLAGMTGLIIGAIIFAIPGLIVEKVIQEIPFWAQGIIIGILLKPAFSFRRLLEAGRAVQQALSMDHLQEARRLVSWHLVSRESSQLSRSQVTSATIESLAENLTDSFLAPLLCFTIGGLPLAWLYRFINTADAMVGYRNPEYEHFGKFAALLDDILNWVPARMAGFCLVLSAGMCGFNTKSALRSMLQQNSRTSSPNAGWTMAAAAGALSVTLEKTGHYTLAGGADGPEPEDIGRAIKLLTVSMIGCLILCGGSIIGFEKLF